MDPFDNIIPDTHSEEVRKRVRERDESNITAPLVKRTSRY